MNRFFLDCYIGISVVIAAIDSILAIKSSQKQTATGKYLAFACACAALVDISYLISILTDSHLCMSVMSSVYFVTIDFMLLGLLAFTAHFIKGRFFKVGRWLMLLGNAYALFELVVFALNPFLGIAVDFVPRNTEIARYAYQMKPLYISHLVFSYVLVGMVIFLLVWKLCQVPREYRKQYLFVIAGILAIVAVNAVFLFCRSDAIWDLLDYSICGYSLTSYLLYWSCFNYSSRGMLNTLKTSIFENVGQGVVLFDYENHLILHNRRADELLGESLPSQCQTLQAFLVHYDLPEDAVSQEDSISLQCYVKREDQTQHPLRLWQWPCAISTVFPSSTAPWAPRPATGKSGLWQGLCARISPSRPISSEGWRPTSLPCAPTAPRQPCKAPWAMSAASSAAAFSTP